MSTEEDRLAPVRTDATSCAATTVQEYFWGMSLSDPDPTAYYSSASYMIEGALDLDSFQRALNVIVDAHPVHRTGFDLVGDDLRQVERPRSSTPVPFEVLDRSPLAEAEWWPESARALKEIVAQGFDLKTGCVVRVRITKLATDRYLFTAAFHHIATDGDAKAYFLRRLFELYEAAVTGQPLIEDSVLSYVDASVAFAKLASSPTGLEKARGWRELLAGARPIDVPADRPRDSIDRRRDASRLGIIADPMYPPEIATLANPVREAITRMARQQRVSIHGIYVAAMAWLLSQATGQTDICIETSMSFRGDHPALASVVGGLATWTMLRVDLSGCSTFAEAVPRAGQAIANARRLGPIHDYYRVVPHDLRRVVVNYVLLRMTPPLKEDWIGIHLVPYHQPFARWRRPWDLHLTVVDGDDSKLTWTGNENLLKHETVVKLLQSYLEVLSSVGPRKS